jgi:hypothetical protein
LLVGEVEKDDPLQTIFDAVETTGRGLTVTTNVNGFPVQAALLGITVNRAVPPESTPAYDNFPAMDVSPDGLIFCAPKVKKTSDDKLGELHVYVVPKGTGFGVVLKFSPLQIL